MSSNKYSVVYCSVPNNQIGESKIFFFDEFNFIIVIFFLEGIASSSVENKLAACVHIFPQITSVYTWQGKIEKDNGTRLKLIQYHQY